ncbi:hypothetical protein [Kerstersia similis]|uniref:hypothetical protein n=1 Tax=Kerstersia similis TaxID=206505 RepID=UPI0039EF147B
MNLSTPLAAVAGAVVAGAAVYFTVSHAPDAAAPQTTPLVAGQNANGELTSTSLLNYNSGVRSTLFTLSADKGKIVKLTTTGALRSQISVYQNGQLITRSQDDCNSCGRRNANETSLTFKATDGGEYLIAVSGTDPRSYGPFRLSADTQDAYSGAPLTGNQRISDWGTGPSQDYSLQIDTDGLYRIDMIATQSELDPYLTLLDSNGMELASDDDGGNDLNARIQIPLAAGNYTLRAESAMGNSAFQGSFDLEIKQLSRLDDNRLPDGTPLTLNGKPASGLYTGELLQYPLKLEAPALVTLELNTQSFDGSLNLTGPNIMLSNSDSGRKRIRTILPAGDYTVGVDGGSQSGLFVLDSRSQSVPANAGGGTLTVGEPRPAVLLGGLDYDTYHFTINRAGTYVIDMKSPTLDTYLWLYQDGILITEDDDSGGNLDAQITVSLEPGTYQVQAGQFGSTARDSRYTISVRPSQAGARASGI